MKICRAGLFLIVLFFVAACAVLAQSAEFDVVIINGHIIDGTGSPWYSGDLGIRYGRLLRLEILPLLRANARLMRQGKLLLPDLLTCWGNRR